MPRDSVNVYLGTVERLEPNITCIDRDAALASIAISLKRIADRMDRLPEPDQKILRDARVAIRDGCNAGALGIHSPCQYPNCKCEDVPNGIRAAFKASR